MKAFKIIITCEHAVNTVPPEYLHLFSHADSLLRSHRGIDFGALTMAQYFQSELNCELIQAHATRLLIDCNRSLHKTGCFSEFSTDLADEKKQIVIAEYYEPLRQQTLYLIKKYIQQGFQVLHLSIHSFTPVLNKVKRNADVGFLYNPQRIVEKNLALQWRKALNDLAPDYRVRMNYPYKGISDGHTQGLRQFFSEDDYVGIEIESNQALTRHEPALIQLQQTLVTTLKRCINQLIGIIEPHTRTK